MPTTPLSPVSDTLAIDASSEGHPASHQALRAHLEQLLTMARPRLLSIARRVGIPADEADDIAQETLIAAWRELAQLRDVQRFDTWLDGICRNLCRVHLRRQRLRGQHQVALASDMPSDERSEIGETGALDIPDPSALDPAEALSRQDLEILLDRALSYVPAQGREVLELCYLDELPQREAALRLGLTISALEARLHRARQRLRQVLSGALRADAEAFGLLLEPAIPSGWRASREWCMLCGRHRMLGTFALQPDGTLDLLMRCPECSMRFNSSVHGIASVEERPLVSTLLPARAQADDPSGSRLLHDGSGKRRQTALP